MLILKDLLYVYTTHSPDIMYQMSEHTIIYMGPGSLSKHSGTDRIASQLIEEQPEPVYFQLDDDQCMIPSNGMFQEDVVLTVDPLFIQPFQSQLQLWFVYDYVERKVIQINRTLVQEWTSFISRIGKKYDKIISLNMQDHILSKTNPYAACPFDDVIEVIDDMDDVNPYNSFKERLKVELLNHKYFYYSQGQGYKNQVRYLSQLIHDCTPTN